LKIVMITMNTQGGMLHYTAQLSNALSLSDEITVIAPSGTDSMLFNNKAKLITLPLGNTIKNFVINTLVITRLLNVLKVIQQENPDVIHFQSSHLWMSLLTFVLKKKGYATITTIHDIKTHIGVRQFDEHIARNIQLRYSDYLIVHGNTSKKELIKKPMVQGLEKKIYVIPHGDYLFFTNYAKDDIKETDSILFFGNILDYKGLEYLIKAEPLIAKEVSDIKLIIAGSGNLSRYKNMLLSDKNYEIHNRFIPDEEVPSFFQRVKVIVLPYIEGTQSGVIPVAYSFKKPVVVTNVGSIAEVVDD